MLGVHVPPNSTPGKSIQAPTHHHMFGLEVPHIPLVFSLTTAAMTLDFLQARPSMGESTIADHG